MIALERGDVVERLAQGLAVSRIAFGLQNVLVPRAAGPSWLGRAARDRRTQVMIRSQGVRDVILGAGALAARAQGSPAEWRRWMAGHLLADATDFAATWAARDALPRRGAVIALGAAAVSTGISASATVRGGAGAAS